MNINRLLFSIDINAAPVRIWESLWNETSYREWASVFFEGSYVVTDNWKEGNKVLFLSPDKSGIYSLIEEHLPNKIIRFKHIGTVLNGKEQPIDEETRKWTGATETYSISEGIDNNTLTIEIDVLDEHLEFMTSRLPKALEKIKDLSMNQ